MIETLLNAAPPAPEPGPNYLEVVGIPLLIAVVTAVVTSFLNNLRTRSDRLATLRVETFRELILLVNRWEVAVLAVADAIARDELSDDDLQRADEAGEALVSSLRLLPLVAGDRSVRAIESSLGYAKLGVGQIKVGRSPEEHAQATDSAAGLVRGLIATIVTEGYREIRRTRG